MNYTQEVLDDLIGCRKTITDPPKKNLSSLYGHKRNGFKAKCEDGRQFTVFIRISEKFEENFSIGLKFDSPEGESITLLRCNGPHGEYLDPNAQPHWHSDYHYHRANIRNIDLGKKPEAGGTHTIEYASYRQALRFFLRTTAIQWTDSHFPDLEQKSLFE